MELDTENVEGLTAVTALHQESMRKDGVEHAKVQRLMVTPVELTHDTVMELALVCETETEESASAVVAPICMAVTVALDTPPALT